MPPRHKKCPLPRLWLFTDERVADDMLLRAAKALPRGSGVVFRHYRTDRKGRRSLFERLCRIARRRALVLVLAGADRSWGEGGRHLSGRDHPGQRQATYGMVTASAHNLRELTWANRLRVDAVFLSPVFATRSHPEAAALGPMRLAALARLSRAPVIALGGMNERRFRRLRPLGAYGWAAIDALTPPTDQK